jgi:hypothetical protein
MNRMADRTKDLGGRAWAALQEMVRDILRRKPGSHLIDNRLPEIDLRLPLILQGRSADPEAFARDLAVAIEQQIDEAIEEAAAFQPGHAFCHRCDAAACEHSRPPTSRHVFLGYHPTGTPRWMEFAQYCLEARHPDFDRLWDSAPAFITILMDRADVHGALLGSFRTDGREVLGQVVAGFFTMPARAAEGRPVLALTFQAVASRTAGGRRRIGLNILGAAPEGEDLALLWERQSDLAWRRAVRWAQAALSTVLRDTAPRPRRVASGGTRDGEETRAGQEEAIARRVMGILQGLARRLEQDVRGRGRRTAHADERHETGDRPTRKAIDDIRGAGPEAFLLDERSGAVVVLGDRGRTHFFTPEGRLVSSVRYSRDAVDRKRKTGLWISVGAPRAQSMKESILRGAGAGDAEPGKATAGPERNAG